MAKPPIIMQMQASDNGAAALCMMLAGFGKHISLQEMRKHCVTARNGSSPSQVCQAAVFFGLNAETVCMPAEELRSHVPGLITWRKNHYAILSKVKNNTVTIQDPAKGQYDITWDKFSALYGGTLIDLSPGPAFQPGGKPQSTLPLFAERLKPYRRQLILLGIFSCASVLISMLAVELRRSMQDTVLSGSQPEQFSFLAISMLITWLGSVFFSAAYQIYVYRVSRDMAAAGGAKLYRKLFRMPASFYEKAGRWEVMERLDQNHSLGSELIDTVIPPVFSTISMVLYTILMFTYSPLMALILLAEQAVFSAATLGIQSRIVIKNRSAATLNERMRSSLMNGLDRIDTIKTTGSEGTFFHLWTGVINDMHENHNSSLSLDAALTFFETAGRVTTAATILFFGAYQIRNGNFTMGGISFMQSVFGSVSSGIISIMSTSKKVRSLRTKIDRVDDFVKRDCVPEIPLPDDAEPDKLVGKVVVSDLSFRYDSGSAPVLEQISFTIEPGEMVALVGSSGSGKSTLMKIISGLYTAESGNVTYGGLKRSEIPDVVFSSSVASVDQDACMFVGTIRDNLKMWDPTIEDYEMLLGARDAQIHNRIIQEADGYSAKVSSNGSNFSGGENQRLELARALSQTPTLLILDEFTSALDALTEENVFRSIRDNGVSCLIAAHRLSTVRQCDKIIVLEHGRIMEMGTPDELYQKQGIYYSLMQLQ